ncbi:MAG TPA: peptidyl-prolyl cis-trans isomerase, partial [Tepidisphaeraceae bacterium]|nr:peptidyl-prolyl cis-trans isomerase [Tepidisphaeraceae bacterium]
MKRQLAVFCLTATAVGLVLLPGCRSNSQPAPPPAVESTGNNTPPPTTTVAQPPTTNTATLSGSDIVATVNGWNITRQELEQPLIDAHGLTILLNLVQLNLAKQQTTKMGLHVSPEDVQRERQVTFNKLFPDATAGDDENLLDQFLRQQHSSRAEFDLTIETNAHLRKAAEVQLPGKITEEMMHSAFGQLYGENRQVRDIELGNMREVGAAQARLAKGEPFAQVAQEMSLDRRTAAVGGELPPFSAQSPNIPQAIKDIAQTLKQGQVSPDAVVVESKYHLIKLERIIPPKVVKYEDVKDSVRKTLEEQWIEFAMREYRNQLAQVAVQTMNIRDPVLAEQWKR